MAFQNELLKSLEAFGERIAIESDNKEISYAELLYSANRITSFLTSQQLENETYVGIQLDNRAELISAIIGILNSRCAFVPIDSSLPAGRLATMIKSLDLRYLITSRASVNDSIQVNQDVQTYFIEDILGNNGDKYVAAADYPVYDDNDSIYVYFTSGSSGVPKGIIGRNKSLLQFVRWEINTFAITCETRVSQFISPYFDAFLRDVFVPLLAGGTICLPPAEEDFFSPEKLVAWIDDRRIQLIHCVPSIFRQFNMPILTSEHFKELKHVLLSGEKIIPAELQPWYNIFGDRIQLVNLYGTTETTMIRAFYKIRPEDTANARIPIGYPISDTELLIATKDFKPCNKLVAGDLYIISDYISKGYLNDPVLTNEKFIILYAGTPDKAIAFKTGDIARRLVDGKIDLIGRDDRQIKIRGMRVEPDEIENILLRSGLASQALALKKAEDNGSESLVAFIIPQIQQSENVDITNEALRYLQQHLPEYMIPSSIITVSRFPLLGNGKINYQELLHKLTVTTIVLPADKTEEKLLSIWKDILGDKPISTQESFQRVGGNSLSIMRLIGRIYKEFNVRISLSELFSHLTIQKQAAIIQQSGKHKELDILPAAVQTAYHTSAAQERAYREYSTGMTGSLDNITMLWELPENLDLTAIENLFSQLIRRHEILRTRFIAENGRLLQIVEEAFDFSIRELHHPDITTALTEFITPFDYSNVPLIRCAIIYCKDGKHLLAVDIPAIVCDERSRGILYGEFVSICNGVELAPLPLQYKDFAEWEYSFRSTEEYIAQREFWLNQFDSIIPALDLPTTHAGIQPITDENRVSGFLVETSTLQPIIDLADKEGITLYAGLFAAYFLFLSQLTGQEDIVIGITTTGRIHKDLENVAGIFERILPIRCQVDTGITFRKFASATSGHLAQAISRQPYEHADILEELNNNRPDAVNSLFETMFIFHEQGNWQSLTGTEPALFYNESVNISKYPIAMFVSREDGPLYIRLSYSPIHFTEADIELLINQYTSLLQKIADNPDAAIIQYIGAGSKTFRVSEDNITFSF